LDDLKNKRGDMKKNYLNIFHYQQLNCYLSSKTILISPRSKKKIWKKWERGKRRKKRKEKKKSRY